MNAFGVVTGGGRYARPPATGFDAFGIAAARSNPSMCFGFDERSPTPLFTMPQPSENRFPLFPGSVRIDSGCSRTRRIPSSTSSRNFRPRNAASAFARRKTSSGKSMVAFTRTSSLVYFIPVKLRMGSSLLTPIVSERRKSALEGEKRSGKEL